MDLNGHVPAVMDSLQSFDNRWFFVLLGLLSLALIVSAVMTAYQINTYRNIYISYQKAKLEQYHLYIEQDQLTLEQQTYNATSRVASRAVMSLGMFYPTPHNTVKIYVEMADND